MYRSRYRLLLILPVVTLLFVHSATHAQFPVNWIPTGAANWNQASNWTGGFVPEASEEEVAIIANGGTAFVQDTPVSPGGITLGQNAGESGSLEVRTGGNLSVVAQVPTTGALVVGQAGTGIARVQNGGMLTAASISSGSTAGSMIDLTGTAQLISTGAADLNSVTNINGQAASLRTAGNLTFGTASALQLDFAGSNAPLIQSGGTVNLGGTLAIDFGGTNPAVGTVWKLFDAADIAGAFSQVAVTNGSIGAGQRFRAREVADAGSVNGVFGELVLEQLLVLEVNRDTGAMRITNPTGTSPAVGFDGYSVLSGHNSFNPSQGVWTSLADQGIGNWIEANPTTSALSEIKTSGETLINGGGAISLGAAWNPQPQTFGEDLEDVVFEYHTLAGEVISAPVVYAGVGVNNLALLVDPVTGEAQLRNSSGFSVGIEGYSILSPSGSLEPTGWISLQDNPGTNDWLEANPQATGLSEIKTDGIETLSSGRSFDLGKLVDTAGAQDLVFEFLLEGAVAGETTLGKVLYQEIPDSLPGVFGDYNNNGVVDASDYTVWRDRLNTNAMLPNDETPGMVTASDYTVWKNNFGMTASGAGTFETATSAVPEPATFSLVVLALIGVVSTNRRFGLQHRRN